MKRTKPTTKQLRELWNACCKFIDEQQVSCIESTGQNDNVILEAPNLVADVGKIVGWYKFSEADE